MRILLTTPDYPPMAGGIQLLLSRLVGYSSHTFDLVAPAGSTPTADLRSPRNTAFGLHLPSRQAEVAALNVLTLREAVRRRPEAILCGHVNLGPGSVLAGRVLGIPVVQYLHSKELAARPRLSAAVLRHIDAAIAVSTHTKGIAAELVGRTDHIDVILPGCDRPVATPPPLASRASPPTIITVARLTDRYKGFDVMIQALAVVARRVPDVRWVVVGDGPLMDELRSLTSLNRVAARVTFTGRVTDRERDSWLDTAHVFAMPSRPQPSQLRGGEGFGIVYLEAGAHRLPVVAGTLGGSADAVVDGETGLLVDATAPDAVADAIASLLLHRTSAARMGDAGARRAADLSWDRMAQSVDALLERAHRAARSRKP